MYEQTQLDISSIHLFHLFTFVYFRYKMSEVPDIGYEKHCNVYKRPVNCQA